MRWTPGVTATVTAACFVTVVAGVGYVVRADGQQGAVLRSAPEVAGSSTTPARPSSPAATQAVAGLAVTLTARPTPKKTQKPPKKEESPDPAPPKPPPTLDFVLSSFNVLGSSHTSGSGKRPGMASGTTRARQAAELIRRHGSDVIGFQELQEDQLATLQRSTNLEFYPGSRLRPRDGDNSLGWQRDTWEAVETRTIGIPYFDGHRREMPYVRLRSLSTGLEAWFANFHNPADTSRFPRQQRFRDRATALEIDLANRLIRGTDLPVFITGDMNEREEYFCRMTASAPMIAARGGSNSGGCRADNPRAVDWIFGSQDVTFTRYFEDRSRLASRTTDHPVIVAGVHIEGAPVSAAAKPSGSPSP